MEKSANKRWKESGSTLSFKNWIDRENRKKEAEGSFIPVMPNSSVSDTINATLRGSKEEIERTVGFKTASDYDRNKIFGLDKRILIFSTILIAGSVGFYLYKKAKK